MSSATGYDEFLAQARDASDPYEVTPSFAAALEGSFDPIIEEQLLAIWLGLMDMFAEHGPDPNAEAAVDVRRFASEWLALSPGSDIAKRAYLRRWTNAFGLPSWH